MNWAYDTEAMVDDLLEEVEQLRVQVEEQQGTIEQLEARQACLENELLFFCPERVMVW
jgi:hypothetical protein